MFARTLALPAFIYFGGGLACEQTPGKQINPDYFGVKTVTPITGEKLRQSLKTLQGKVVVVNIWATWCPPCVPELRELAVLGARYKNQGLVVLSINMNPLKDHEIIHALYTGLRGELKAFTSAEKEPAKLLETLVPRWGEIVPFTVLFDKEGRLAERFAGGAAFKTLEKRIQRRL